MRARHWAGWVVGGVLGAAACTGHGAVGTDGGATGTPLSCPPPEPQYHRPSDTCPTEMSVCNTDADCGDAGDLCSCTVPDQPGSACVPAAGNCRVDADCGAGFFCSPSFDPTCGYEVLGFYCHTCQDECTNATECNVPGTPPAFCGFFEGSWQCQLSLCTE
jgi:hypothetical protein